jgi:hypothetical protein
LNIALRPAGTAGQVHHRSFNSSFLALWRKTHLTNTTHYTGFNMVKINCILPHNICVLQEKNGKKWKKFEKIFKVASLA